MGDGERGLHAALQLADDSLDAVRIAFRQMDR
jgi:hypothetical protein